MPCTCSQAVPSWFVRVESIKDSLIANNEQTYWVPAYVKEKRFHNWLENARDWAVSRSRFWGTPLPVWTSEDGEEIVVIGSVEELEQRTGAKVGTRFRGWKKNSLHCKALSSLTQGWIVMRTCINCISQSGEAHLP